MMSYASAVLAAPPVVGRKACERGRGPAEGALRVEKGGETATSRAANGDHLSPSVQGKGSSLAQRRRSSPPPAPAPKRQRVVAGSPARGEGRAEEARAPGTYADAIAASALLSLSSVAPPAPASTASLAARSAQERNQDPSTAAEKGERPALHYRSVLTGGRPATFAEQAAQRPPGQAWQQRAAPRAANPLTGILPISADAPPTAAAVIALGGERGGWALQAQAVQQQVQQAIVAQQRLFIQHQQQALILQIEQQARQNHIASLELQLQAVAQLSSQASGVLAGQCAPAVHPKRTAQSVLMSGLAPPSLPVPGATS